MDMPIYAHKLTQAYKTRKCWNFSNDNLNSNLKCEKKKMWKIPTKAK